MQIGGIQKFSALDYPNKLSCVVFCQGCPLKCHYCHNKYFQDFKKHCEITDEKLYNFLKSRIGLLDAVVFSGGEPLCQIDLKEKMFHVEHFGFLIGLHTSGYNPEMLESIIKYTNWIGFDIKNVFQKYETVTKIKNSGEKALDSFNILKSSGVSFEVRTTYDSRYMSENDLIELATFLKHNNIQRWVIQQCVLRNDNETNQILPLPQLDTISKIINIEVRK